MASRYGRGCGADHVWRVGVWLFVAVSAVFVAGWWLTSKRESESNYLPHLPDYRQIQR